MNKTKLLYFVLIMPLLAIAHTNPTDSVSNYNKTYNTDIDSLANLWYVKQMSYTTDTSLVILGESDSLYIPDFPDSVYISRLAKLPLVIDMSYNNIVRNYIHMYTHKKRPLVEQMLGLTDYYFPLFEQLLDANGMPLELKYLPVIESALNPNAVSRVGATGLWQFMYYTGRQYKLDINSFVDDRRDPIKSTYAAIGFLNDLYDIYQDWILVIAAYNCGPGNVNKAIRRSGGVRDYWKIYYHLPRETRGYVPAFIAATYVMNYYNEHNFTPTKTTLPVLCDTILINKQLHLEQVSKVLGLELSDIRALNPQYRRNIIPGHNKTYALRLPFEHVTRFIDLQDSIYNYNTASYFNAEALSKAPEHSTFTPGAPNDNYKALYYTVKSGDNLGFIATWYNVRVADIRYWNNIRRNMIRTGQKLVIYVPKNKVAKYSDINKLTFVQKQNLAAGKPVTNINTTPTETTGNIDNAGSYVIYEIQKGDTLWEIAKQYPGVTEGDLMRWNNISNASKISVGQKIKIIKKS